MQIIYDVSHNIAKEEEHLVGGRQKTLLVHRKGSTRAFPPHHPLIPVDYQVRPGEYPAQWENPLKMPPHSLSTYSPANILVLLNVCVCVC